MTDTSGKPGDDRRSLADRGATMLGPLLARFVANFVDEELTPAPTNPLSSEVLRRWRTGLRRAVGMDLEILLHDDATELWATRGLPVPGAAAVGRAVALAARRTIGETDNLAQTLADAAAGREGSVAIAELLDPLHQEIVGSSLTMSGVDQLYDRYANGEELTGRRRWRVADPETSRHSDLDGEVADAGEGFTFGDLDFSGPREDPADVEQWSNCSCVLEYETIDGTWL